jgi:hypothetical protein
MAHIVNEEKLIKFEQDLNKIKFDSIPVGSLIVNFLYVQFYLGRDGEKNAAILKDRLLNFYLKKRGLPHLNKNKVFDFSSLPTGLPLLTFASDRNHFFNINYPLFKQIGSSNCITFLKFEKFYDKFGEVKPKHFFSLENLSNPDLKKWNARFSKIKPELKTTINDFVENNKLPYHFKIRIINEIIIQTIYVLIFEKIFFMIKPAYIVLEYDRLNILSVLASVGKKMSVPVYTMSHGIIANKFAYSPLIANKVFSWGEKQKKLYESIGVASEEIYIAGASQFSDDEHKDSKIKEKYGFKNDDKIILLATNPIRKDLKIKLANLFGEAVQSSNGQIKGIIKIHPSEKISDYDFIKESYPIIKVFDNKNMSYEDTFKIADLICVYNSAISNDALIKKIPVAIINISESFIGQNGALYKDYNFPVCNTVNDLKELAACFFSNKTDNNYKNLIDNFISKNFKAFGTEAAKNVLEYINNDR